MDTAPPCSINRSSPSSTRRLGGCSTLAPYSTISSMGLRSLMRAEKRLHERHGGVVLVGLTTPTRHLLEIAGLLGHFRVAQSVEAAVELVRAGSVARERAAQRLRQNRSCSFWPLAGRSVLEVWGSGGPARSDGRGTDTLQMFTLEDLGFAFGVAGLGETAAEASEAAGPFL